MRRTSRPLRISRKDNGKAIREVCRAFVALCRETP